MLRSARVRTLLFLTLVATAAGTGWVRRPGAGGLTADAVSAISGRLEAERQLQRIPGLTVAVATPTVRWSQGFGLADLERRVPAGPETVYRLASLSKPITATAVLQLAERGQLDLDAPIQSSVPGYPAKAWDLTARHLLGHQGGIRWYRGDESVSTRHYTRLADTIDVFRDDPLLFEPGTRYLYSSYGYNLLGVAVETASGRSFLDYLRDEIFEPAGMTATGVDDATATIPHRARLYRRTTVDGPIVPAVPIDTSNRIPGGGLCGTASDVAAFGLAVQQAMIVRPESREAMFRGGRLQGRRPTGYGLGWHTGRKFRARDREVWHKGNQAGTSAVLYLRPDRGLSIALLTNVEGAELLDLARQIADLVDRPIETSW